MSDLDRNRTRRLRGAVLQFVSINHREQRPHMDNLMLWGLLQELNFSVDQNNVLTLLQDLKDHGYLTFIEKRNLFNNRPEISHIAITPAGRDLVERTEEDKGVLVP